MNKFCEEFISRFKQAQVNNQAKLEALQHDRVKLDHEIAEQEVSREFLYTKCQSFHEIAEKMETAYGEERLQLLRDRDERRRGSTDYFKAFNALNNLKENRRDIERSIKHHKVFKLSSKEQDLLIKTIDKYNRKVAIAVRTVHLKIIRDKYPDIDDVYSSVKSMSKRLKELDDKIKAADEAYELLDEAVIKERFILKIRLKDLEDRRDKIANFREYLDEEGYCPWLKAGKYPNFIQQVLEIFNPEDPTGPDGLDAIGDCLVELFNQMRQYLHPRYNNYTVMRGDRTTTCHSSFTINWNTSSPYSDVVYFKP